MTSYDPAQRTDKPSILDVTYNNNTTAQFKITHFGVMGNAITFITEEKVFMGLSLNFVTSWALKVPEDLP